MADFDENGPELLALAVKARLQLEVTFFALRGVTDSASPTAENASALQRAGDEIRAVAQELCDKLDRVPAPMLQGDIANLIDELIAIVFEIGARSAEARSLGEERKKIQSDRGKAGAPSRKKDAVAWRSHCDQVIAREKLKNTDELTVRALSSWPKALGRKMAYGTVKNYVAERLGNPPGRPRAKKRRAS